MEKETELKSREDGDSKETKPSKHRRTAAHVNSWRLSQHTQGLHKAAPHRTLLKGKVATSPQSGIKTNHQNGNYLQMKI